MQVECIENYCKNVDQIIDLTESFSTYFHTRAPGETYNFSTAYGDSHMKSMFSWDMPLELKNLIQNSLPEEDKTCDGFSINKYDSGDYLLRHRDIAGGYWKFKLIFLRSDRPHFAWYDEEGQQHLIDEKPGMLLKMPINLEHEVTKIGEDERSKYSLVLSWGKNI